MNILLVNAESGWRGGEQQFVYLAHGLQKEGIAFHILCRSNSLLEKYCLKNSMPYSTASFSSTLDLYSIFTINRVCKVEKINLIHVHGSKPHSLVILTSFLGNRLPVVVTRRVSIAPKNSLFSRWKYTHPRVKRVIGISREISNTLELIFSGKLKPVTIYSAIDPQVPQHDLKLKEHLNLPAQCRLVGTVAAFTWGKDHETLVEAAKTVISEGKVSQPVYFVLIGDGPLLPGIRKKVKGYGLEQYIFFTGYLEKARGLIKQLDVFLLTSKAEGLGTSLLDAFASGVPVVCTNAGGMKEVVEHRKTGWVASVGDSEGLATGVQRVLEYPNFREEITANATARLHRLFTVDKMVAGNIKLYREVLNPERG